MTAEEAEIWEQIEAEVAGELAFNLTSEIEAEIIEEIYGYTTIDLRK